jgi:hypothetical protein
MAKKSGKIIIFFFIFSFFEKQFIKLQNFATKEKPCLKYIYIETIPKIKTLANTKQKSYMGVYDY